MIRKIIFNILLLAVLACPVLAAYGQCSGPSCGIPQGPIDYGSWRPSYPPEATTPPTDPPLDPVISSDLKNQLFQASVMVYGDFSRGMRSRGSGTIFRWGDSVGILTVHHAVENVDTAEIEHPTLGRIRCRVVYKDSTWDYAILEPQSRQAELYQCGILLYDQAETNFTQVILVGYDGDGRVRSWLGRVLRFITGGRSRSESNWIMITGTARPGDSGGGIFAVNGRLVGVIWGTDERTTYATWVGPATVYMRSNPTCFIWRFRREPPEPPKTPEIPKVPEEKPSENPGPQQAPAIPVPTPTAWDKIKGLLEPTWFVLIVFGTLYLTWLFGVLIKYMLADNLRYSR